MQGRPKDGPEDKFRLTPVVPRLEQLLGTTVSSDLALAHPFCKHETISKACPVSNILCLVCKSMCSDPGVHPAGEEG